MDSNDRNKKIISLSITLFIIMLLVGGGTLAYWTWVTAENERTNVSLTITAPDLKARLTGYTQNITNLIPVSSCTDSTYAIKKQLTLTYENNSTNAALILGTLSVENFNSPYGTPDSDDLSHLHYAVTMSADNCIAEPIEGMSGTFTETSGQLFSSQKLVGPIAPGTGETSMTFYLWVWLDSEYTHQNVGSEVASDPMQDISFTLVWSGEINNDLIMPNAPLLDVGMIPVKIANNGTVTTVAANDPTWYNYDNKEWANVVLVNEEATADIDGSQSREYYKNNLSNNVEVNQSDILAYYVWIPRYKYKIWNIGGASSPKTIEIEFESNTVTPVLGTMVDDWRTHPAFIWDGNPVTGIWVGKFETSHSALSLSELDNLVCEDVNCDNADGLIIKPNVISKRADKVSFQFYASRSLERSGNPFGFVSSNVDTHMMKNTEWGAVSYLSHSIYGINGNIRINNNNAYITGCGASLENGESSNDCEITYGAVSLGEYPQSTTGNITGVFDMSGGAYEYVMGYYSGANENFGYNSSANHAGFSSLIESKYWDEYTTMNVLTACNGGICYGQGLSETLRWYGDYNYFILADYPWLSRGGPFDYGVSAGLFNAGRYYGDADIGNTFRIVVINSV